MASVRHPSSRHSEFPFMFLPDGGPLGVDPIMDDSDTEPDLVLRRKPKPEDSQPPPAPRHPIPSMQDAFAESLIEATTSAATPKPKLRTGDAKARRDALLDQAKSDGPPAPQWRFRPGQKSHELRRLMAQISFGVYLLLNGMANSQISVVSILQGHIDEVDEFLETTLEDLALATKDLKDRIEHLKLPMNNMNVFEQMLEDRNFRLQILEGNQKIEHILARTEVANQQITEDIEEGVNSTREFTFYLGDERHGRWRQDRPDMIDIFDAMKGNTDGWYNAFLDLQSKAGALTALIGRLTAMVSEIERKAGEVSRRTRFSIQPYTSPGHSPQASNASSSITTPPTTPGLRIANSPPRLSLRLSSIKSYEPMSFMDIHIAGEPLHDADSQAALPQVAEEIHEEPSKEMSPVEEEPESEPELELEPPAPQAPPARNPRRLSERPAPPPEPIIETLIEAEEDEDEEEEVEVEEDQSTLYILQPRTYTPQPPSPLPSPLPSPFIVKDVPKPRAEFLKPRMESPAPSFESQRRQLLEPPQPTQIRAEPRAEHRAAPEVEHRFEPRAERRATPDIKPRFEPRSAPRVESDVEIKIDFRPESEFEPYIEHGYEQPKFEQARLRTQPSRPKLVAIGARPEPKSVPRIDPRPDSGLETDQEMDHGMHSRQQSSLRERVSLKTTPPESIQVPPPNVMDHQRPRYESSRTYQSPDSAYVSDMERPPVNSINSIASIDRSLSDFSPPYLHPGLLPSPQSDQQYFRPVQASPYSPLQQRPHTAGTTRSRHPPPRNIPSAMGMSMMSNTTTATNETGKTGASLKKKRSAFGWLKKAFSLDEEERLAFEQKKREQTKNLYYDSKSPQFLDGRRIQPRPRPAGY
ncbi:hypothetical protein B0H63DRAFT_444496 [Podospora didyma]|uniref:Uncharacterized protein n=1 Tax=Podospora didyma TaxID=330526 RepID=A0AAE0U7Y6_9PEZI|nr:hypothetical protein B0H63DRAFT_444496 [Podospora didyma]